MLWIIEPRNPFYNERCIVISMLIWGSLLREMLSYIATVRSVQYNEISNDTKETDNINSLKMII